MKIVINIDLDTDNPEDVYILEDILRVTSQLKGDDSDDTGSEGEEESS